MSAPRVGDTVRLRAFFVESKVGKAGLTVTLDYVDPSGNVTAGESASAGGVNGVYYYNLAIDEAGEWVYVFKTATTSVDQQHLAGAFIADAANTTAAGISAAVVASLTGGVTVVAPVNAAGTAITVVKGDAYLFADGRHLAWTLSGFPSLVGATLTFTARDKATDLVTAVTTGTVTAASTFYVELSAAQTRALTEAGKFDVQAVLVGGATHVVTVASGTITALEDQTR